MIVISTSSATERLGDIFHLAHDPDVMNPMAANLGHTGPSGAQKVLSQSGSSCRAQFAHIGHWGRRPHDWPDDGTNRDSVLDAQPWIHHDEANQRAARLRPSLGLPTSRI